MGKKKATEISVREVALRLGKRLDDTYKLIQAARLKGRKVDGRWLVSVSAVEAFKQAVKRRIRVRRFGGSANTVPPAEARV